MLRKLLKNIGNKGKAMLGAATLFNTVSALLSAGILLTVFRMLTRISGPIAAISGVGSKTNLWPFWWVLFGMLAAKLVANVLSNITTHFAGFELEVKLKEKIIRRLKQFSLGFYTKERLGEISTVVQDDVDGLEGAVAHFGSKTLSDGITALVIGIALFILDWRMGLVMLSLLPAALWAEAFGIGHSLKLRETNKRNLEDMVSRFVEYTKGIPMLKAFSENRFFRDRLRESASRFGESSKAEAKAGAYDTARYSLPFELCFGLVALVGAVLVWNKMLDGDKYVYFIVFSLEFYRPFASLESYRLNYTLIKNSYGRIAKLLGIPVVEQPAAPKSTDRFDVRFDHVGFRYEENGFELRDADFRIEQGSLTALVGPSGSGKTTITNLLLRFWDCDTGAISIGGVDIREMDYDTLLSKISIVMQNVTLFADTVEENIRMGNRQATREQVIEAAKKAMIHDSIMRLPDGYDTMLGENGVGLSGGERQRLSIARAFLKDSPIVLLDEATSNVDPLNEVAIQNAISNLAVGRTVLVIAHYLQTIRAADQILVIKDGRITERGTHTELLQGNGLYAGLWSAQQQAKSWRLGGKRA